MSRAAAALLLLASAGCGSAIVDEQTIVVIDEREVSLSEFRLYLRMNLLDRDDSLDADGGSHSSAAADPHDEPAAAAADDAQVKSRLLDAFIDERLLLAEAERRGIEVSDLEVAAYLAPSLEDTDEAPPILPESRRAAARDRLKVDRVREAIVLGLPPPTERDVHAHLETNRERLTPKPRFVLRPLLFESLEEARRVHREIRRGRMSFDEAVVIHAPANVRVATVEVAPEALPEAARERLATQRVGTVSPPFDMHGQVYVFRLEDRIEVDAELAETTARALARDELERLRGKAAIDRLIGELRARARIRVLTARLPFDYGGRELSAGGS